jgi:hypothetical protein
MIKIGITLTPCMFLNFVVNNRATKSQKLWDAKEKMRLKRDLRDK